MNPNNDRRVSARLEYDVTIQCSKYISEGKIQKYEPPLEIQVSNISSEGFCISTTELFMEGGLLEFDIILEEVSYKSISATIIWSIKNENLLKYGLHVKNKTGKFGTHIYKLKNSLSKNV